MQKAMVLSSAAMSMGGWVAAVALLGCGQTQRNPGADPFSSAGAGMSNSAIGGAGANGGSQGGKDSGGGDEAAMGGISGFFNPTPNGGQSGEAPWPSSGCNELPPQLNAEWHGYSVHVTGATLDPTFTLPEHDRAYGVWLPHYYDITRPHRVVYLAMGCGSSGVDNSDFTSSSGAVDPDVIFVGLAGPPSSIEAYGCTDNSGAHSTEWEYFALVATAVEKALCVDKNDELIVGRRTGGTLANMLGCYFSGVDSTRTFGPNLTLRAQLAAAGALPSEWPSCGAPIAAMWLHDPSETPPIADARAALEHVLAQDGCSGSTTESFTFGDASVVGCQKYTGCGAQHPVLFCETPGRGRQSNYYGLMAPAERQLAALLYPP